MTPDRIPSEERFDDDWIIKRGSDRSYLLWSFEPNQIVSKYQIGGYLCGKESRTFLRIVNVKKVKKTIEYEAVHVQGGNPRSWYPARIPLDDQVIEELFDYSATIPSEPNKPRCNRNASC